MLSMNIQISVEVRRMRRAYSEPPYNHMSTYHENIQFLATENHHFFTHTSTDFHTRCQVVKFYFLLRFQSDQKRSILL